MPRWLHAVQPARLIPREIPIGARWHRRTSTRRRRLIDAQSDNEKDHQSAQGHVRDRSTLECARCPFGSIISSAPPPACVDTQNDQIKQRETQRSGSAPKLNGACENHASQRKRECNANTRDHADPTHRCRIAAQHVSRACTALSATNLLANRRVTKRTRKRFI